MAQMGGSVDDARDVFQDDLVIYYEKTVAGNLVASDGKAYLLGIAKHLWFKKFKEQGNTLPLDDSFEQAEEAELRVLNKKVLQFLESAGKRCMELLSAFYYHKLPVKEAAEQFGYAGERSVTVQKYKCLEKVRTTVKERSLSYADFVE